MKVRFIYYLGTVGKTSLFNLNIKGDYKEIDKKNRTINAHTDKKIIEIDKKMVQLNIWDTAGEEKYHALAPNYYRDAEGALLVLDITKIETLKLIEKWIDEINKIVGEDFQILIAANKYDLINESQINDEHLKEISEKYKIDYIYVSAKDNKNVDNSFNLLGNKIFTKHFSKSIKKKRTIKVIDTENKVQRNSVKKDGKCC